MWQVNDRHSPYYVDGDFLDGNENRKPCVLFTQGYIWYYLKCQIGLWKEHLVCGLVLMSKILEQQEHKSGFWASLTLEIKNNQASGLNLLVTYPACCSPQPPSPRPSPPEHWQEDSRPPEQHVPGPGWVHSLQLLLVWVWSLRYTGRLLIRSLKINLYGVFFV